MTFHARREPCAFRSAMFKLFLFFILLEARQGLSGACPGSSVGAGSNTCSGAAKSEQLELEDSDAAREAVVRQLDHENVSLENLIQFIYRYALHTGIWRIKHSNLNLQRKVTTKGGYPRLKEDLKF